MSSFKMENASFYRRELPATCVALSSRQGQQFFRSAMNHSFTNNFFDLISQFHTQTEPAFCGPSTLVMILNAFSVDPRKKWKGPWRWFEESMLNCCIDLEKIKKTGITFSTFVCLAQCQGLKTQAVYGAESTLEEFRNAIKIACGCYPENCIRNNCDARGTGDFSESSTCLPCGINDEKFIEQQTFLVVSYNRKILQQTGTGHFSPIAAYDPKTDSALILDTARFKYPPHWVKLDLLFESMKSVDVETGRSRGYVLLSYEKDEICNSPNFLLPQSLLFRSTKSQNPARLKFKVLLDAKKKECEKITFREVLDYFISGSDYSKIWTIVEPAEIPLDRHELFRLNQLLHAIQELMEREAKDKNLNLDSSLTKSMAPCSQRLVHISILQTIFIIYLSTLDPPSVSDEIRNVELYDEDFLQDSTLDKEETTSYIHAQIQSEVALIRNAIDHSSNSEIEHCRCGNTQNKM